MKTYDIPMVPGPTSVYPEILEAGNQNFGSADLERDFLNLYVDTRNKLKILFNTKNSVVIQSGEGMLALWSAMKSCLIPKDKVLCIATGVFGYGFEEMAKSVGCETMTIGYEYYDSVYDFDRIEKAIKEFKPKMITIVQNETPSGTVNSISEISELKEKYNVPLLYVDAVSGLGGCEILTDKWKIDLCLGASQKCLSAPCNMSFLTVSPKAWKIVKEINYVGYDALLPFYDAVNKFYFPYTPDWHGIAQLNKACDIILEEGLEKCFSRHIEAAEYCRDLVCECGLKLFWGDHTTPSTTVTAIYVPDDIKWEDLDRTFRKNGLVVGGSYGCLAGKVFRIGHMGSQANITLIKNTFKIIRESLFVLRKS